MLFIIISFGQEPEFIAAIVEPLALTWRQVFAFIFRIDEEIGVSGENYLHQSSAVLRQDNQFNPPIGKLLRMPAPIIRGFNAAGGIRGWMRFTPGLAKDSLAKDSANRQFR
jgi:hypothetical protein